jgi:hypothetical protein
MMIATIDAASSGLINLGVTTVKRNPIKMGFWVLGLLLAFFINGTEVTQEQLRDYGRALDKIPTAEIHEAEARFYDSRSNYEASRGWFWTCSSNECINNKAELAVATAELARYKIQEREAMRDAKQSVGVFSAYGVQETRNMFWSNFNSGKNFATRQTKWDALFIGISAMGRDEKLASFLFRIVTSFLMNITVGLFGAVVAFWWNLWGLVTEYRAGLLLGLVYFLGAGLAALSFALMWLFGIYAATAGTVFVAAKVLATNVRIEDRSDRGRHHLN